MSFIRKVINKVRGSMDVSSLIKKGLTIGNNVFINFGCVIDDSFCFLVSIGNNVTLAPNVHILAHDASTKGIIGYTKIRRVEIGDYVFIGAGSIVLPGVSIGENVIIGAGSVITKDISSNCVVAGNPAKVISSVEDYKEKYNSLISILSPFEKQPSTEKEKQELIKLLTYNKIGLIR